MACSALSMVSRGLASRPWALASAAKTCGASAAGVSARAMMQWLDNAKTVDATPEEVRLLQSVNEGRAAGGMRLMSKIAEQADDGDLKASTRMLTHAPAFRAHYSDNAAVTRARQEGIEAVLQAIAEAGLAPDQERDLLLRITAKTGHNATII